MFGASTYTVAESRMMIFIFLCQISSMLVLQGRAAETPPASPSTVHLDPSGTEHFHQMHHRLHVIRPTTLQISNKEFAWCDQCQQAFEEVKRILTSSGASAPWCPTCGQYQDTSCMDKLEHVCRNPSYMAQTRPGVLVESYCKPVFKPYSVRCGYNTICTRYRTVYYLGYRKRYPGYQIQQVSRQNPLVDQTEQTRYKCCPGWTQTHKRSSQCSTPVCDTECQHGGRCVSPDTCACPAGWTGRACEVDVNECDFDHHGCSQLCKNSNGSHQCGCYEGFSLMADGRTCQVCITCSPEFQALLARVELIERELGEMKKNHTLFSSLGSPIEAAQVPAPTSIPIPGNNLILNDQHISQIERIQSLSEQMSMLEERLDGCTCRNSRQNPRQNPRQNSRRPSNIM